MDSHVNGEIDVAPPQASRRFVLQTGLIGLAIAFGFGLAGVVIDATFATTDSVAYDVLSRLRNFCTPLGVLVAGCAVSLRPNLVQAWLIFAAAAASARFGFVPEWDSARLVMTVMCAVALLGAIMISVPMRWRYVVASSLLLFHYSGILSAVTSPPPQPFLTGQAWTRIFRSYLHFAYMNNAYQFYSPDPGPASEVWACIEFEPKDRQPLVSDDGQPAKPKTYKRWFKVPRRPQDFRDPLGQSYFRRLALTEQLVAPGASYSIGVREQEDVFRRRQARLDIRFHPEMTPQQQYRPPTEHVRRLLLPAYAKEIARVGAKAEPTANVKSLKMYRVQHQIISAAQFAGKHERRLSPYDPVTYVPIFQGEYDANGNLLDSKDPLLYWVIPIVARPGISPDKSLRIHQYTDEDYRRYFDDYVYKHADSDHRKELLP